MGTPGISIIRASRPSWRLQHMYVYDRPDNIVPRNHDRPCSLHVAISGGQMRHFGRHSPAPAVATSVIRRDGNGWRRVTDTQAFHDA